MIFDPDYYNNLGTAGLTYILIALVCIVLAWWGLQQLKLEAFLKNPRSMPAKLLLIFASVALGYQVAQFLFAYSQWTTMLRGLLY